MMSATEPNPAFIDASDAPNSGGKRSLESAVRFSSPREREDWEGSEEIKSGRRERQQDYLSLRKGDLRGDFRAIRVRGGRVGIPGCSHGLGLTEHLNSRFS